METHGRDTTGEHLDTVGWFTAITRVSADLPATAAGTEPDAGVATCVSGIATRVSWAESRLRRARLLPMDVEGPRPEVAFNFLGTFRLPAEPLWAGIPPRSRWAPHGAPAVIRSTGCG